MIYRFVIISDEVDDFRRDLRIDSDVTFLQLNDAILECVGYDRSQITSFTICDEQWEKTGEVTMIDESRNMEDDVYLMKDTQLDEFLTEERQKLIFHFDMLGDRSFFIELREITYGESIGKYEIVKSKGNPPKQESDIDALLNTPIIVPPIATASKKSGSVGRNGYDEDYMIDDEEFYSGEFEIDSPEALDEQGFGIEDDIF